MDDRAGLIEWHLLANMQGEIGGTYNTTQDVAAQGVLVSQPEVGQHSRFVLCYRVAVDHGVNTCSPHNNERLANEGVGPQPPHLDA